MDVVAVGDIVAVGHALDDAETLLQALRELVGRALERRAVDAVVDVLRRLPLEAVGIELLHDLQTESLALVLGELLADQRIDAFPQSRVAERDGGIAVEQQLVDGFALFQTRERAVLPQNRRRVGQRALESFVTRLQGSVTKLHALVEDLPEFVHVAVGAQSDVDKVDGDDALIEASVILMLAGDVVARVRDVADARVGEAVGCQERTAAHAGVDVALQLEHDLLGDVVGHHPLGGALGGKLGEVPVLAVLGHVVLLEDVDQLGERRGDPHACLILHALIALSERLLNDHREVSLLLLVLGFVEVHIDRHERRLSVGGQEGDDLILDRLDAAVDLLAETLLDDLVDFFLGDRNAHFLDLGERLAADLLTGDLHERREVRQADALTAVLVARDLRDDLRRDVAGGREAVGLLDEGVADDGAVLQHVLEVDEVAVVHVLGEVVGVVEVDQALLIRLDDVGRKQHPARQVAADLACHVVALDAVDGRVLVGVLLLDLLVVALDQREDAVVGGVRLADERAVVAVAHIASCQLERALCHQLILDHVLNLLDRHGALDLVALVLDVVGDVRDLLLGQIGAVGGVVRLADGVDDFFDVEVLFGTVSFDDFHAGFLPFSVNLKSI